MSIDTKTTVLPNAFLKCMSPKDRPKGVAGMTADECHVKSERELQNLIENWFRLQGIPAFRQRMDKRSNMKVGTPDFIVCHQGGFYAFEVKVGNNVLTKEQNDCLNEIETAGGQSWVVRSLSEVKRIILTTLK